MHRRLILLAVILLSVWHCALGQTEQFHLRHINTKGYAIRVVYRDANGIVWLGTTSGLLTLPQLESHAPSNYHRSQSEVNMSVRNISGDSQGRLWIKTHYNDNYLYDPRRNQFVRDVSSYLSQRGLDISLEYSIMSDDNDNIWVWKENKLYILPKATSKPEVLAIDKDERLWTICSNGKLQAAMSQKTLYTISADRKRIRKVASLPEGYTLRDNLFISSDNTMWVWSTGKLWKLTDGRWDLTLLSASDITGVAEDKDHRLWVSSQSDGIYICNLQGDLHTNLRHTPGNVHGLQSNKIQTIKYDPSSQTIWIAYTKGGLSVYGSNKGVLMTHSIADFTDTNAMTDVLAFAPAKGQGGMWIGLEDRGVWLHDGQGDRNVISRGSAVSLYASHGGQLWAGIYRQGLFSMQPDGQQRLYLEGSSPFAITEDDRGNIFAALLGKGIWQINPATGAATDTHIPIDYVFDLVYNHHRLYAATTEGLYVRRDSQWQLLTKGHYHYLSLDPQGYIWLIGNEGSEGLTLLDHQGKPIDLPKDLATAPLKSIAADAEGNVWTVTSSELLMLSYHPHHRQPLRRYTFKINAEEQIFFNNHKGYIDGRGTLWLGTTTGYHGIDIHHLLHQTRQKSNSHKLVLGAICINDNVLSPGQQYDGRVLMQQDVIYTKHLDLRYNENNLVLECSTPDDGEYITDACYYQLRGFSPQWHPFDGHSLTLSNLPPGHYELLTRTQSSAARTLLTIHIAPPLWLTWWAFCLYALLLASVAYIITRHYRNRRTYRQKLRELKQQQEQQEQMNELKLRFFTNISHDLRTPLSLIIGPVEEMLHSKETNAHAFRTSLSMVHRNAQHLLSLVNQILDMRRLEFGHEKLLSDYGDIVSFVGDICSSFRHKAEKDHIRFTFRPTVERVETMFDRDKTTKILMNLLSNAFKFTPTGGTITVSLDVSAGNILIAVSDTGEGISPADKPHIFDRFYKSDDSHTSTTPAKNRLTMGSGIGLHIVRQYVHMQSGEITVSDNTDEGQGTIFRFNIPLKKNNIDQEEPETSSNTTATDKKNENHPEPEMSQDGEPSLPLVLLVDDNSDLLSYMSHSLADDFRILTAADGKEALTLLKEHDADIMVSDIMMPVMDGLELCRHIKHDIETSHIPIVLLTAKSMTSDELRGLESGADDYITKPFSMDILKQRLHNIVERSRHRHERFAKEIDISPSEITVTSLDEQFIAHAISIVEQHISDADYSIEQLSDELGMHRAQLYKKLMHLTGKSPQQFMRMLRLKRGKQLLEQSGLYVSEVAYRVGFNSPRIFSKYFKQEFGVTPKDYASSET